jgi:hypothetical protein
VSDSVGDVATEVYRRLWIRHGLALTGLACASGVLGCVGYVWVLLGFGFTRRWDWGIAAAMVVVALVCAVRETRGQYARIRRDQQRTTAERLNSRYDSARTALDAFRGGGRQWWRRNRKRPSWWITMGAATASAWAVAHVMGHALWGVGYAVLYCTIGVAGTRQAAKVAAIVLFEDPRQPRYTPET